MSEAFELIRLINGDKLSRLVLLYVLLNPVPAHYMRELQ